MRTVTKQELEYFAKTASNQFINNKKPLDSSIQDIAQDNVYLNREHLKRIVEMANSNVYQHLYDTQEDKNIKFDLANPNNIEQQEPAKIAFDNSAYLYGPRTKPVEKVANSTTFEDDLKTFRPEKEILKMKLANAKEYFESNQISHGLKFDNAYYELKKEALSLKERPEEIVAVIAKVNTKLASMLIDEFIKIGHSFEERPIPNFVNEESLLYKKANVASVLLESIDLYEKAIKESEYQLNLLKE